jgi:dihydroorotase-like cyclic amidohydrolase
MVAAVNNLNPAGGVNTPAVTPNNNQVGTPDQNTVNALQNELNGTTDPANNAGGTPGAQGPGITAADMKIFMDEMNKFCVQQGISTTPKATRD